MDVLSVLCFAVVPAIMQARILDYSDAVGHRDLDRNPADSVFLLNFSCEDVVGFFHKSCEGVALVLPVGVGKVHFFKGVSAPGTKCCMSATLTFFNTGQSICYSLPRA